MSTLSLGKNAAHPPAAGSQPPPFDENAHYGVVGGVEGVGYVQGDWYYGHAKQPVKMAPPEARLAPLTPEQERARQLQLQANRKFFGSARAQRNATGAVPESVVKAERENAQARAAEVHAA